LLTVAWLPNLVLRPAKQVLLCQVVYSPLLAAALGGLGLAGDRQRQVWGKSGLELELSIKLSMSPPKF
jgi:hypothetical protein